MNIQKLRVRHFGKLKNMEVQLKPGLNVIYGENESGKSTLQAFIKAMFYGMNSLKKTIRENDRKRFLPWSGGHAAGELYFQDDYQNEYVIKRSFGVKKKEDESVVFHAITGENAIHIRPDSPGIDIFGLGEQGFEKTVWIRQLGNEVVPGRDDEIMQRLMNLQESGDESISYHKALNKLNEARKNLLGQRRNGKLAELMEYYEKLQEERRKSQLLHQENIEDQICLNQLVEEKTSLEQEIRYLEDCKKQIKEYQLYEEYKRLCEYQGKIDILTKQKNEMASSLQLKGIPLRNGFIEEVKETYYLWLQDQKQCEETRERKIHIQRKLEELQGRLDKYRGYEILDDNMEFQLLQAENEVRNMEEKLAQYKVIERECANLEMQLNSARRDLGVLSKFEKVTEAMEIEVYNLEETLKKLKHQQEDMGKEDRLILRRNISMNKNKSILMMMSGMLMTVGGMLGGWFQSTILYALAVSGLIMTIYGMICRRKRTAVTGTPKNMGFHQLEIDRITKKLHQIYSELDVATYHEFYEKMRKYSENKNAIEGLKTKIQEKKEQLEKMHIKRLKEELQKKRQWVQNVFNRCRCNNLEEFMNNFKYYQKMMLEKKVLESEAVKVEEGLNKISSRLRGLEKDLLKKLQPFSKQNISMDQIDEMMEFLVGTFKNVWELEQKILSLEETLGDLLRGRSIEEIQKQWANFSDKGMKDELPSEETVDMQLKNKHQQLLEIEKQIKDKEHHMQYRMLQGRPLTHIEEEMGEITDRIQYYEEMLYSIDLATKLLQESFHEIQRNFGPRLNRTVGDILGKITGGKYDELKISENYGIKIIDPIMDKIKDIDYFSSGTSDQIYFALRMGLIDFIFGEKAHVPILLDDAFVQYDEVRLEQALAYLYERGKEQQIILFTCQKREITVLQQFPHVNFIHLTHQVP